MLDRIQGTSNTVGIAERRAKARLLVSPPVYVNLNNVNGGLVFNLSEEGLTLTAALTLADDHLLSMRFQLPESGDWIEVSGQIAWKSKSKKEAGVQFVGLKEDVRQQIRNWITLAAPCRKSVVEKDTRPGFVGPADDPTRPIKNWITLAPHSEESPGEKDTRPRLAGLTNGKLQQLRNWILSKASRAEFQLAKDALSEKEEHAFDPQTTDRAEGTPHTEQSTGKTFVVAERRARTRALVSPPIYVNLNNVNGGLVFNMSEDGLALRAAIVMRDGDDLITMRIRFPDSLGWMEVSGQIVWKTESTKSAGLRFVGLTEDARIRIRNWISGKTSRNEPEAFPKEEQQPSDGVTLPTPEICSPPGVVADRIAGKHRRDATLPADPSAFLKRTVRVDAEPLFEETRMVSDRLDYTGSSSERAERRVHRRSQIRPVSYMELGRDNGATLLNLSEGGLALTAAKVLADEQLPAMRIQFTGSRDWIDAIGEIVWVSESRRKAGVRFVGLTEEARQQIRNRISLEASAQIQGPRDSEVVQEQSSVSIPSRAARPTPPDANVRVVASAPYAATGKPANKAERKRQLNPEVARLDPGMRARTSRLAALVSAVGVTVFAVGWIVARHAARSEAIGIIGEKTKDTNEPVELKKSLPANETTEGRAFRLENSGSEAHGLEPVPADGRGTGSLTRLAPVPPQAPSLEHPARRPPVKGPVGRTLLKSQSKLPGRAVSAMPNPAVKNARSQPVESMRRRPAENTATPGTSPFVSVPNGTALAEVKEKESPATPLKLPAAPIAPTWSVAVSTDPYPSIRIPPEISLQKASHGRSLVIGRVISRVEPLYPEDAKLQGIEGTVQLHVVVDRDGTVESVKSIGGPALLREAATNVVRRWRYSQSLLGGQPVETEQDIVVKFRLVIPSSSKN